MSASIPDPKRHPKYWKTSDNTAIRDAVRALAELFSTKGQLVYGGHPAITPLISYIVERQHRDDRKRIHIYQSQWFEDKMPVENSAFETMTVVPSMETLPESLQKMREEMFAAYPYKAAIFIGGMEGIEDEYRLFHELHPKAQIFPVASTGAAARLLFKENQSDYDPELATNYSYASLFRRLLKV